MSNEEIQTALRHFASKEDVANLRVDLHRELHALTWRVIGLLIAQTTLILGAMYYMLTHK